MSEINWKEKFVVGKSYNWSSKPDDFYTKYTLIGFNHFDLPVFDRWVGTVYRGVIVLDHKDLDNLHLIPETVLHQYQICFYRFRDTKAFGAMMHKDIKTEKQIKRSWVNIDILELRTVEYIETKD